MSEINAAEVCRFCGEPCDHLAGNPGLWPLVFCMPGDEGAAKAHHVQCVVERLARGTVRAEVGEARAVIDKFVDSLFTSISRPQTRTVDRIAVMLDDGTDDGGFGKEPFRKHVYELFKPLLAALAAPVVVPVEVPASILSMAQQVLAADKAGQHVRSIEYELAAYVAGLGGEAK